MRSVEAIRAPLTFLISDIEKGMNTMGGMSSITKSLVFFKLNFIF